ncbi:MAG: multifunctional CCA addition/repair protein [Magnetococcales bacterium]|nr:multifunctional CCA addition/repair protein [Magnetococcales bacterium]
MPARAGEPLQRLYRVGGWVRDHLLGLPAPDRDWVVVGETPQTLQARGFMQVGADFPVFLHPESGEAYALARQERKTGPGYRGFATQVSADVTLEEDLARRDLTINAMAMDSTGAIIDPFGGQEDLKNRLLRHVSPAFVEDPLRVLRVARFLARFWHLGFRVAPETLVLLSNLVAAGELQTVAMERIWQESVKALTTANPLAFFDLLQQCGALAVLFPELAALVGIPQPPLYHPEGDVWQHTRLTLAQACRLSDSPRVRFAALLHDVGKAETPQTLLPHHYGHETRGVARIHGLCDRVHVPTAFRKLALAAAQYHLQCHRVREMRPGKVVRLLARLNAFHHTDFMEEFITVCHADANGRLGREGEEYPAGAVLRRCGRACVGIDVTPWRHAGLQGSALGAAIHQERIVRVRAVLQEPPC